jgi:adenylate cyclase
MPNQASVERRLAAILAADVVGYSSLMETDEVGILFALKAIRRDLVDPTIARHNGRIVKTTGDGILVEFASVVAAVSCAIAIQRGMMLSNSDVREDKRIVFRIGINVGDVIIENGDIFGDGVNIAARLEAICEPGGLCISRTANDQIRDKFSLHFIDRGEQTLKNIARAVGVYQLASSEIASLQVEPAPASINPTMQPSPALADQRRGGRETRPTLAVLPFDNLSHPNELEDFCDGLVEDATTALSKFRWLNVVARNSSFAQRGRMVDVRQIARDLNVGFILEGSVRRSGNRIRITAQLIDGRSGNHLWAERYDHEFADLFDLQDQVIRNMVASLEYVLWTALMRGDAHRGAPDPEVSPLRAAGWHILECTHHGNRRALECATRALHENPRSIAAHQYLANAYIAELLLGWTDDPRHDLSRLLEAGRQAVALNPADSLSQGLYGCALALAGEHDDALTHVERALTLNANSVNVLGPCSNVLSFSGTPREANDMLERMFRLAPAHYCRAAFLLQMALNFSRVGEHERGLSLAREAIKLKPDGLIGHITYGNISAVLGRAEAAQIAISNAHQLRPNLDLALVKAMYPHRDQSIPERMAAMLGLA